MGHAERGEGCKGRGPREQQRTPAYATRLRRLIAMRLPLAGSRYAPSPPFDPLYQLHSTMNERILCRAY